MIIQQQGMPKLPGTDPREFTISYEEKLQLLEVPRNDPVHDNSINFLHKAVFSETLDAKILSKDIIEKWPSDDDLQLFAKVYYRPQLQKAYPHCLILGYSVYTHVLRDDDHRFGNDQMLVPQIVPPERYNLKCWIWKDERIEWKVYPLGSAQPDPDYHVFFWPGCEPNPYGGKHNSMITSSRKLSTYLDDLYLSFVRAQKQRSHPPFLLEQLPPSNAPGSGGVGMFLSNDPFVQGNAAAQNKVRVATAYDQATLIQSLRIANGDEDQETTPGSVKENADPKEFKSTYEDNRHWIPSGWKASQPQPQLPEAQQDLLDFEMLYEKLCYARYGIPYSIMMGDGKTGGSQGGAGGGKQSANMAGEKDYEELQRTLLPATITLCQLAEEMWMNSWIHSSVIEPQKRKKSDLGFKLRIVPYMSSSTAHRLFEQDIIHEEAKHRLLVKLHGLHEDDLAKAPNKITRPPLNGTENQTTDFIKAKVDNIAADSEEKRAKAKSYSQDEQSQAEKEKLELEMKLERMKFEFEKELMQMKLEYERQKLQIQKEKDSQMLEVGEQKLELESEKIKQQKKKQKITNKA